jgi:hypothetical protein
MRALHGERLILGETVEVLAPPRIRLSRDCGDDGMPLDHALDPHEQYSVSVSGAPE